MITAFLSLLTDEGQEEKQEIRKRQSFLPAPLPSFWRIFSALLSRNPSTKAHMRENRQVTEAKEREKDRFTSRGDKKESTDTCVTLGD